ncbi:hypothetical protein PA598K_05253 [Paenibacillus sp. 598K]|uniref:hypothetical protein n=1 Tax=Paenibacillus sp. 598K TaxID=1117987 RepID=UPI000FF9FC30|nr:hypothetical protein [Paenibacillus sp. 598K]GBF76766.1 hypothetical protein PA598K_05253 [Paenibacillus sp. 598K]
MKINTNEVKKQMETIEIPASLSERSRAGIRQAVAERQAPAQEKLQPQASERPHSVKPTKRTNRTKRTRRIAAASLIGVIALAVVLSQQSQVWATLARALQFVPGLGIVQQETSQLYVLQEPVRLAVGSGTLTITGAMSDERMTVLSTSWSDSTIPPASITLTTERGIRHELTRSLASGSGGDWSSIYWIDGPIDTGEAIRLTLPLDPPLDIPLALQAAESYADYEALGPTQTHHGLSITAAARRIDDQLRVTLLSLPQEDYRLYEYDLHGLIGAGGGLQIADHQGNAIDMHADRAVAAPASEFYFTVTDGGRYRVTLPEVFVEYPDTAKVKLPTESRDALQETVELAGFPVTFTRTERIGDRLRVYMDMGDPAAAVALQRFSLRELSYAAEQDETTGAYIWMEFEVPDGARSITLQLERPIVVVRGPWTFDLSS